MTVILYDKLANREELQYDGSDTERITLDKTINGVEYAIVYEFRFFDKKLRPVFVESKRNIKKATQNAN